MTVLTESLVSRRQTKRIGWFLFICVFVFYALIAPAFSVPGRWAGIAAIFSGLDPFRPVMRPVWSGVTALLSFLPIGNIGWAFNLLTAAAGAASCWLLFEIVRRIPFSRTLNRATREREEAWPRLVAGVSAALFAAASFDMIALSTRGDYAVFDIFLLLLALYPVALFIEQPRWGCVHASCAFMGFALVEYPTAALVLPGFLIWWGLLLWKAQLPKIAPYVLAGSLLLSGVVALMIYTILYDGSLAATIRDLKNPGDILLSYLRLYYAELTRSVPRVGWLLIIGFNIVPFIAVMLRELDEPTDAYSAIGVYLFRAILVVLAIMSLFNLPGSPGHVIGRQAMLLAPAILVAAWSGYLLGYYTGIFGTAGRRMLARVVPAIWLVMLLAAGVRHGLAARVGHLEPVVAFADGVVEQLKGRDFIITDGSLDPSLQLAARIAGIRVNVINLQTGTSSDHGRYYATMFDAPDFQALAMLGTSALLRDWLTREPGALGRTVLLASPALLRIPGIEAYPERFYYTLARKTELPSDQATFDGLINYWWSVPVPDAADITRSMVGAPQSMFVNRWLSRLANDAGYILDEHSNQAQAASAYEQALRFWPENISALLNLKEQAVQSNDEKAPAFDQRIKAIVGDDSTALNILYLDVVCGKVRNPGAQLAQITIRAGTDATGLDQLANRVGRQNPDNMATIAGLYLRESDPENSEAIYRSLLETNPDNLDALHGLFRVAIMRNDVNAASELLSRIEKMAPGRIRVRLDRAALTLAMGDDEVARAQYQALIDEEPGLAEAWNGIAQVALKQNDQSLMMQAKTAIDRDPANSGGMFILGEWAFSAQRWDDASVHFMRALEAFPDNQQIVARLLQVAFMQSDYKGLRSWSARLLALNPDDPLGNRMAGLVHMTDENHDLAEASFRRSLAAAENADVLSDLALALAKQEKNNEALLSAQRVTSMAPENANAWNILAGIEWQLERFDDAFTSTGQAIKNNIQRSPGIFLDAAVRYAEKNRIEDVNSMLTRVGPLYGRLNQDQKARWTELMAERGRSDEAVAFTRKAEATMQMVGDPAAEAKILYDRALVAIQENRLDEARSALARAAELEPGHPLILWLAGRIELLAGDYVAASSFWRSILEGYPDNPSVLAGLAGLALYQGNVEEAGRTLDHVMELNPAELSGRFYRAVLAAKKGAADDVVSELSKAGTRAMAFLANAIITEKPHLEKILSTREIALLARSVLMLPADADAERVLGKINAPLQSASLALEKNNWEGVVEHLAPVRDAGVQSLAVEYDLALARYKLQPGRDTLASLAALLNRPGGDGFTGIFVLLCLQDRRAADAEQLAAGAVDKLAGNDLFLIRAALRRDQGDVDGAWRWLEKIPRDQRPALRPWFDQNIPVAHSLRSDSLFAPWIQPQP